MEQTRRVTSCEGAASLEAMFHAQFGSLVRAFAVGCGDGDAAADAVMDAFVQAYRHWSRISRYDDPLGWVRRVAANRLLTHRRDERRREQVVERLSREPVAVAAAQSLTDPVLIRAIQQLPRQQRLAVSLHYLLDLSVTDVADALGISTGATKSHLYRARAQLATTMEVTQR
jgi:RNA polymerase sigma-70 factor (ECF subfamily)